jgi:putative restriction endonuclease
MPNHARRAFRAWPVLTQCAAEKRPITYGELGAKIGIHHRAVVHALGEIQWHCQKTNLPPLTILVINASRRVPGGGFIAWDVNKLPDGMREVYETNWALIENPFTYASTGSTLESLGTKLAREPESAGDIYRLIKDRGHAQVVFRKALLIAYDGKCAFCGLHCEEALQGAHIIPWEDATPEERLAPSNGLLLCATHHCLFDGCVMTLSLDGRMVHYDPHGRKEGPYGPSARAATMNLHGLPAHLPKDVQLRPAEKALKRRHNSDGWDTEIDELLKVQPI